jgi:mitogen-activated protein kinase 1/3
MQAAQKLVKAVQRRTSRDGRADDGPSTGSTAATTASPGYKTVSVDKHTFVVPEHLDLIKKLGSGAYGVVASFREVEDKLAVKKVTNAFHDLVDAKRIVREIKLLRFLKHDNIIRIRDVYPPPSPDFEDIYIAMDLMDTDLHRVIISKQKLTVEHTQYFMYQILRALKYLHSAGVVHRDLKPSNVLVNKDCELKICDFGLARAFGPRDEKQELTDYVVTRWYRAPEVVLTVADYTKAIDVWSAGCILVELVGRKPLLMGKDHLDQIKVILSVLGSPEPHELEWLKDHGSAKRFVKACEKSVRKPWPELYPSSKAEAWTPDCVALIDHCLRFDPNHRCTVEQALQAKFLSELHDPSDERVAKHTIDWSFDNLPLTKRAIQNAVYQEAGRMHPEIFDRDSALLAERKIARPSSKDYAL